MAVSSIIFLVEAWRLPLIHAHTDTHVHTLTHTLSPERGRRSSGCCPRIEFMRHGNNNAVIAYIYVALECVLLGMRRPLIRRCVYGFFSGEDERIGMRGNVNWAWTSLRRMAVEPVAVIRC